MCKACGSQKILIHKSNLMGEELCWTCYVQAVNLLFFDDPKKQLENVSPEALNPLSREPLGIMGE